MGCCGNALERAEAVEQRCDATAAQRDERLSGLPAETLQGQGRVVADAIDRKDCCIGAAHKAGKHVPSFLDAAVMVNELSERALDERPQARNLVRSPPT